MDEYSTNTLQFDSYELRIYKIPIQFDSIRTNFTNYELFVGSIGALVCYLLLDSLSSHFPRIWIIWDYRGGEMYTRKGVRKGRKRGNHSTGALTASHWSASDPLPPGIPRTWLVSPTPAISVGRLTPRSLHPHRGLRGPRGIPVGDPSPHCSTSGFWSYSAIQGHICSKLSSSC